MPRRATWVLGGQLGGIIAVATALQTMGLQQTTASRAGFLVQLSTVFVPFGEAVNSRQLPSLRLLAAMTMSLVGTALLVVTSVSSTPAGPLAAAVAGARSHPPVRNDHAHLSSVGRAATAVEDDGALISHGETPSATATGDALIVLAAALYSVHILALGKTAAKHQPLELATSKSLTQLLASFVGWTAASLASIGGEDAGAANATGDATAGVGNADVLLTPRGAWIALWTGLVTCAYPMWAQTFGKLTTGCRHRDTSGAHTHSSFSKNNGGKGRDCSSSWKIASSYYYFPLIYSRALDLQMPNLHPQRRILSDLARSD